jgi:ubiquitin carboxyl-terminal hydrolase L5
MNADSIDIGSTLGDFKSFAGAIDAESKGIAIGNSETLRAAHNSFAHPEPFLPDESHRPATEGR